MVDLATIITIVISIIIIGVIGFFIYRRIFGARAARLGPRRYPRMTQEGEPLEDYEAGSGRKTMSRSSVRLLIPIIIGFIVLIIVMASAVKIVDAGYRGVLLNFGAVDTSV